MALLSQHDSRLFQQTGRHGREDDDVRRMSGSTAEERIRRHATSRSFPVPGNGLKHGNTGIASKVVMFSTYNSTAISSDTDVMDAFKSFSHQLWSLTILAAAILTVVVFFIFQVKLLILGRSKTNRDRAVQPIDRQRTRRCMHQALVVATANILKQHTSYSFRGNSLWAKIILFLFALFSFLITFYFSSMIKTDMVVQKRPETISSYEDLLAKPNIKPLWTKQLGGHWDFMHANRNTAEGRIWERAKKYGIDSCFLKSLADIQQNIGTISRQEAVWFGSSNFVGAIITNACAFSRTNDISPDVNSWFRSDENARETLTVLMQAAALPPESVTKMNRIIQAEFEHHVLYQALTRMEFSIFPDTGGKSLRDCVANGIIYPDYEIGAVHLPHYSRLWFLSGYGLLFCLSLLSSEMMAKICRRSKAKNKPETWILVRGSVIP